MKEDRHLKYTGSVAREEKENTVKDCQLTLLMMDKEMNNPHAIPTSLPPPPLPQQQSDEIIKSRRSMSIQSICDPLASSAVSISDHDSDVTLVVNERMSIDGGDIAKLDSLSLSPSEEQAIRALEELGHLGQGMYFMSLTDALSVSLFDIVGEITG